ncbi:S9 family peptidase [Bailinhaonella thermotolerans]|uniref:S9 family peptidase n=1 Tax=Bailinhaonella thermotolerans TaxID=1070861 RepID=A0A3A4AYF1_9ACTN|nr:S9 family peptidase [Bailinhaonella thermotolerans]RJL33419.1 S9 family peptidase [Bailinhaonella thermotolerans]
MSESFPRMQARTRRFTLGVPRGFTISPDGARVVFLRTRSGTDPVTCLWELDVASGEERLVADPRSLSAGEEDLPPEERARRERTREQAGGVVGYATDEAVSVAAFALSGQLYAASLTGGTGGDAVRLLPTPGGVIDPRPNRQGTHVAYVSGRTLRVIELSSGSDRALAEPEHEQISYGLAEFIAAEEMGRMRGYWWSPAGDALLVARVDETPVQRWNIADPANPGRETVVMAYPAAGTPNADVELVICGLDGGRVPVRFEDEYLVNAVWSEHGLLIVTQPRDQRALRIFRVDPATGATTPVSEDTDPAWVEIVPGVPAFTASGRLVWVADSEGGRRLVVDGRPVTPPSLQVRAVVDVDGESVLFTASGEPTEIQLWQAAGGVLTPITTGRGVYGGRRAGGTTVITEQTLETEGVTVTVQGADGTQRPIPSFAERPGLDVRVELMAAGERELRTAVILPSWHKPGSARLPVLMDPYGGPHAQRVLSARGAFLASQWFADQGFAVIVSDGRGTPARGPEFERAILGDLATPVLEDQVEALKAAAERFPDDLDLTRVGIRGWSFGGYLAALAAFRRPDVFHAAIAGAPVTDWTLYDTHYTERYLGDPAAEPEAYERSSLIEDAGRKPGGREPALLLIHGLADDNVVAAHTLRLSSALLAAGRPHSVLPLSGVTHMTPQEVVAENLLLLQVDFLKTALGVE